MVGRSAIFSGEHFVLEETDWYLLNLFRLWWHYGISFLRLQMWVEEVMEKFMRYGRAGRRQGLPEGGRKRDGEGPSWTVNCREGKGTSLLVCENPARCGDGSLVLPH